MEAERTAGDVFVDSLNRTIFVEDSDTIVGNATIVKNVVPKGVNIFALLNLAQPQDVNNLTGWTVLIGDRNGLNANLQTVFKAIEKIQWHSEMPQEIYRLLLGLYLPVMILGTTLNALLLFTMLSTKKLRTDPRNSFILALAFSDFFLCNFTSPLTLWSTLEGHWPFGGMGTEILCRFVKAGQDFPIIISSFCIGAIACDRFRYIVTPYRTQMTASQGFLVSMFLAFLGAVMVAPVFVKSGLKTFQYLEHTLYCEVDWPEENRIYYSLITSVAHYFLTLVIVIVLYANIYLRLRSRPPSQHAEVNRRRTRTNILLASITAVFFICWAPLVIFSLIYDFRREWLPERAVMASFYYSISLLSGMSTPIINPVLYSLLNDSFRDEIGKKLKKLKACCKPFNQKQSATTTLTAVETGNGGHCRSRVGGVEVGKKKKQVVLVTTTTVAENGGGLATGNVNVATENTGSASADASAKLLETSL